MTAFDVNVLFTEGITSLLRHRDQTSISALFFVIIAPAVTFGWGEFDMSGESGE
jgi:hypothetical protein